MKNVSKGLMVLSILTLSLISCGGNIPKESESKVSSSESVQNSTSSSSTVEKITYTNPLVEYAQLLDPAVIKADDGLYYMYVTSGNQDWKNDGNSFNSEAPIYRSEDLVNWVYVDSALSKKPGWDNANWLNLWSPEIAYINDQYVYYYSLGCVGASSDTIHDGVGVAVSDYPEGPFEDKGKLFDANMVGNVDPIDPCIVQEDGHVYMFFGNYDGICYLELNSDGTGLKYSDNIKENLHYVAGSHSSETSRDNYTAPYVKKIGQKWYLFASNGEWISNGKKENVSYHTVVFQSDSLFGPYVDSQGNSALEKGKGDLVIEGDDKYVGTGNVCVIDNGEGAYYMIFHAYVDRLGYNKRYCCMEKLDLTGAYPVVEGTRAHEQGSI